MRTVFAGGSVFDARTGTFQSADVLAEGERIVDVASGLDGDEVVDCAGRWVMPGLVDTHVHLMLAHVDFLRLAQTPFSLRFYEAIGSMQATLGAGITTVRDAGGADLGLKTAVDRGLVPGPRMQISLTLLSQTGGHGDDWMPSGFHLPLLPTYPGMPSAVVDGPDEMRKKVREVLRAGADVIKVATSGGVLSPTDDPTHAHFGPAELEVLVAEAATQGAFVMAHAQAAEGIKNAVRAGIRSIEHGIYLDDEAIELMVDAGTWLVPTLVAPLGVIRAAEGGASIPEGSVRKAREVVAAHEDSFRRAVAAGVKVAMGTDSAVTPHGENLDELPLMADGGMAPSDVLRATTIVAAELMGWDDRVGSLEPGRFADVVVLDADPLDDLAGMKESIEGVWKGGERVV
jgi:imidazolonepropionase-like amidohydrolase